MSETPATENNLMAAMSYVGVLVFVPLLTAKDNDFIYFHAKQGLVLLIGMVVALVVVAWLPVVGSVLFLGLIVLDLMGLVQALLGKRWRMPGVGLLVDKDNI